jgi:hypothetical protein
MTEFIYDRSRNAWGGMSQQRFSWIWIGRAAFVAGGKPMEVCIDGKWKFIIVSIFNTNSLGMSG